MKQRVYRRQVIRQTIVRAADDKISCPIDSSGLGAVIAAPLQYLLKGHSTLRLANRLEQVFFQTGVDAVKNLADLGLGIRLGAYLVKNQAFGTGVVQLIKITSGHVHSLMLR